MHAHELIALARQRSGLTQAELGRAAGTTQPVISAYEHGHRDPGTVTLARLIAAAGSRLDLRLAPADPSDLPPPLDAEERAARLVDVLLLADAYPPRQHRRTLEMPRMVSTR